jgi:hypothetical protein
VFRFDAGQGRVTEVKLRLRRGQAKGVLGNVKFELAVVVELTPEEQELVKRYKADRETLLQKDIRIPFTDRAITMNVTIGMLMYGQTFKCAGIAEILEYEKNVRESCQAFKSYLEVMRSFGGEEVLEF